MLDFSKCISIKYTEYYNALFIDIYIIYNPDFVNIFFDLTHRFCKWYLLVYQIFDNVII